MRIIRDAYAVDYRVNSIRATQFRDAKFSKSLKLPLFTKGLRFYPKYNLFDRKAIKAPWNCEFHPSHG